MNDHNLNQVRVIGKISFLITLVFLISLFYINNVLAISYDNDNTRPKLEAPSRTIVDLSNDTINNNYTIINGSSYNVTYNNLLSQECPANYYAYKTLSNGSIECRLDSTGSGNMSWNQTYATTLYAPISTITDNRSWNQTYASTLFASISSAGNSSWNQTYATTLYAPISTITDNRSWNQTYASTLFSSIIWGYNHTQTANSTIYNTYNSQWSSTYNSSNTIGSGVVNRIAFWNGTNSITSDNGLYYDSTSNYLGIGITPVKPLHLYGTSASIRLQYNGSGAKIYDINPFRFGVSNIGFEIFDVNTSRSILAYDGSENWGMGISSPTYDLEINRTGIADSFTGGRIKDVASGSQGDFLYGYLRDSTNSFSLPGIWMTSSPSFSNYAFLSDNAGVYFNAPTNDVIQFRIANSNAVTIDKDKNAIFNENLSVDKNVGIGIINATEKLDVRGNIKTNQSIMLNGANITSNATCFSIIGYDGSSLNIGAC